MNYAELTPLLIRLHLESQSVSSLPPAVPDRDRMARSQVGAVLLEGHPTLRNPYYSGASPLVLLRDFCAL